MILKTLKLCFSVTTILVLSACTSDSRYDQIQSARLDECNYMADKEYHACIKRQVGSYDEYKERRDEQQVVNDDKNRKTTR